MKYLLLMHVNPATMAALTDDERNEIMTGHEQLTVCRTIPNRG